MSQTAAIFQKYFALSIGIGISHDEPTDMKKVCGATFELIVIMAEFCLCYRSNTMIYHG
jgi:hypothetical protein